MRERERGEPKMRAAAAADGKPAAEPGMGAKRRAGSSGGGRGGKSDTDPDP